MRLPGDAGLGAQIFETGADVGGADEAVVDGDVDVVEEDALDFALDFALGFALGFAWGSGSRFAFLRERLTGGGAGGGVDEEVEAIVDDYYRRSES